MIIIPVREYYDMHACSMCRSVRIVNFMHVFKQLCVSMQDALELRVSLLSGPNVNTCGLQKLCISDLQIFFGRFMQE